MGGQRVEDDLRRNTGSPDCASKSAARSAACPNEPCGGRVEVAPTWCSTSSTGGGWNYVILPPPDLWRVLNFHVIEMVSIL